ncbi:FolC bifunctional protein [Thermosinus carboxydivorans Nor1]|uniref:tetrahydrofolate synthase n=1 Tax=Thermosinus carboxydivorans Nor1 TaxID=401526 RepID=A1HP48_9FIRM|nr:folylpolyglutamate synthase/dihydrofolate synthase family protein [Thermosinus carboxydivorans]EAX48156.1 FolC bifunctional protein [Thermosinus carboxydivorans Nor1]
MTYQQALEYLATLNKFGINLGLARIKRLLDLMGHPERRYRTVHVTGTNGKGSTTAMLAAILQASGIKTGMYTSPHLVDYTERMVVDGRPAAPAAFAAAIDYTRRFIEQMTAEGWEHPTEFEVLTAAAFHYFAEAKVEYAVIEVGLGGLLDSTNVISPEAAVITNVALEHTDRCGATVREIARHKAGIIKAGVPVITAAEGEALAVIREAAAACGSMLYVRGRDFVGEYLGRYDYGQRVAVHTAQTGRLGPFSLTLLGRHQVENCAIAVMTALVLAERGAPITPDALAAGLAAARWPGRFEVFPGEPVIVVDGAHNPHGARALRVALDEVFGGRPITFLLGILRDKDITGIVRALVRPQDMVVAAAPLSERAAAPGEIAREIGGSVEEAPSIAAGLAQARRLAGADGVVCAAGSLYLIGAVRQILLTIDK